VGDRLGALRGAVDRLDRLGLVVEAVSAVWETAPLEVVDQPAFLNAAVRVRSDLPPSSVLTLVKRAEDDLGRRPGRRYGPRAIDVDLLLWDGGAWRDERLELPHPRLPERRFALLPLVDLDSGLTLPDGRRLGDLLAALDPAAQPAERLAEGLRR
jgi:2-amino-4-hydroxy-6-hydroxymethyldihydropteridine diphosphokinase